MPLKLFLDWSEKVNEKQSFLNRGKKWEMFSYSITKKERRNIFIVIEHLF